MNKKQRILVLEDEAFTRNQIKEFLENQEYEVIAPKQPDCFEQWENEQQPDLILLDIGLGSQDGIQLCKRLRKDTQVPIMFVTGENTTQMEVQGLQAGGDDYIRKPFDFCVLLIRIQNLLKRARSEQDQLCVEGVVLDLVFGQFCNNHPTKETEELQKEILLLTSEKIQERSRREEVPALEIQGETYQLKELSSRPFSTGSDFLFFYSCGNSNPGQYFSGITDKSGFAGRFNYCKSLLYGNRN